MNQLSLFAAPKESKERNEALVRLEYANELMSVFEKSPNEFLSLTEIFNAAPIPRNLVGTGPIFARLEDEGKIISEKVFFGAKHPSEKNYLGFTYKYKFASAT